PPGETTAGRLPRQLPAADGATRPVAPHRRPGRQRRRGDAAGAGPGRGMDHFPLSKGKETGRQGDSGSSCFSLSPGLLVPLSFLPPGPPPRCYTAGRRTTPMSVTDLQAVAQAVTRRAQRQGFVLAREVREELEKAGLPTDQWRDVLALARSSLRFRQGRYHYVPAVSQPLREDQHRHRGARPLARPLLRHCT